MRKRGFKKLDSSDVMQVSLGRSAHSAVLYKLIPRITKEQEKENFPARAVFPSSMVCREGRSIHIMSSFFQYVQ